MSSLLDGSPEGNNAPMEEKNEPMHVDPFSQSVVNNDFKFQQTLSVHQGSVRCLAVLPEVDTQEVMAAA